MQRIKRWREVRRCLFGALMVFVLTAGVEARGVEPQPVPSGATRYFELTLAIRTPAGPGQEPRNVSLTTDVAVLKDRPGASFCRARITSQVPVTMRKGPTYLDLGTKLDCNDVHMDGNALAFSMVLETSRVNGVVATVDKDGKSLEEPLISQRSLELQVRLPLGKPTVVFREDNMDAGKLQPLPAGGTDNAGPKTGDKPAMNGMQVEMTARELR